MHGHFRYCRLRAYNSRAAGRRPLNPYAAGRPTSRAIQWYTGLLVCNHCVVSYAPITDISPVWADQVALGVPHTYKTNPVGIYMGLGVSSQYPPGASLPPTTTVGGFMHVFRLPLALCKREKYRLHNASERIRPSVHRHSRVGTYYFFTSVKNDCIAPPCDHPRAVVSRVQCTVRTFHLN